MAYSFDFDTNFTICDNLYSASIGWAVLPWLFSPDKTNDALVAKAIAMFWESTLACLNGSLANLHW